MVAVSTMFLQFISSLLTEQTISFVASSADSIAKHHTAEKTLEYRSKNYCSEHRAIKFW
jgi:hypothetical protein